ncbi:MAG TPA: hypothetical protein VMY76_16530 [Gemmatimonadales bacterium]|nr:hypothetical protein [Gemmatimonadales bacterium]
MSPSALERLAVYFAPLRTRQGILARAALGTSDPGDVALGRHLIAGLTADIRADGSVAGGAMPTIWRGHELLDLGLSPRDPAMTHLVEWLLARQGRPGAYGDGCDKVRHGQKVCEHFVQGFFAPAPPQQRITPITVPNGKAFRSEPAARFAISCLGLRLALRAGLGDRPGVVQHLDTLRALAERWTEWDGFFSPDVIVAGLHALALGGAEYRTTVEALVGTVSAHQRVDGFWANADTFATLDALLASDLPEAQRVMRRVAPELAERQRADGAFGATAQQERALIALRALLAAAKAPPPGRRG